MQFSKILLQARERDTCHAASQADAGANISTPYRFRGYIDKSQKCLSSSLVAFVFIVFIIYSLTIWYSDMKPESAERELRTELISIRLTPSEKRKVEEACLAHFELRRLPLATLARELLLHAVESILKRKAH